MYSRLELMEMNPKFNSMYEQYKNDLEVYVNKYNDVKCSAIEAVLGNFDLKKVNIFETKHLVLPIVGNPLGVVKGLLRLEKIVNKGDILRKELLSDRERLGEIVTDVKEIYVDVISGVKQKVWECMSVQGRQTHWDKHFDKHFKLQDILIYSSYEKFVDMLVKQSRIE